MFVYANPAFVKLVGYSSFGELEAVPVLDLVVPRHRQRLREHLTAAQSATKPSKADPRIKVALVRRDGSLQEVLIHSHRASFLGEETMELFIQTEEASELRRVVGHHPWTLYFGIFFLVLFTVLPIGLLFNLTVNNAPKVYLPADAPSVLLDEKLREQFPSDQVILLLFEGVALFSDGFVRAFAGLADELRANPLVDKVLSMTTQDHIRGTEDGFIIEPLVDAEALESNRPETRRGRALADRFSSGALVARDGSAVAMVIMPADIDNILERLALENAVLRAVENAQLTGYLVARAGQIPTDVAQLRSMARDNILFIPLTTIIGLFLIWWLFHRLLAVIVAGAVIGVIVSSTVALYVLFDQPFNLISSIIPPLLSALTVAALVHLYNALHYASKRGLRGSERVSSALAEIHRPALYTSLTTSAGLASLGLSPIPPIMVFGLISAAGVLLIYFVVIHVVPPIFTRFDYAVWPSRKSGLAGMDLLVRRLLRVGVRYPARVVIITVLALAFSVPYVRDVVVETNLQEFFYPDHELRKATDYIEQKLVGTTSLDVVVNAAEANGLKSPALLNAMRSFQVWAESQPEVDKTISLADFVEEMNWGFNGEDDAFRKVPDNADLVSQYLLIYDGEDLFDFVDEDYTLSRISLSVNVHGANDINNLMERIRHYFRQHPAPGATWDLAGAGRLFADQEDLLIEGQLNSLFGALGLIFLLMLVQWRSFGGALLCMIPNLSPIVLIFIIMGVFGIWLDMATAMIASVAVGIAVDDTIHVYHGFSRRVKRGVKPVTALVRSYRQAGRAVITTTIILSAQFLVLTTSQFVPTTHFGLLTSIGLVAALLFDLLLLPALLILIYGNGAKKRAAPLPGRS